MKLLKEKIHFTIPKFFRLFVNIFITKLNIRFIPKQTKTVIERSRTCVLHKMCSNRKIIWFCCRFNYAHLESLQNDLGTIILVPRQLQELLKLSCSFVYSSIIVQIPGMRINQSHTFLDHSRTIHKSSVETNLIFFFTFGNESTWFSRSST